MTLIIELTPEEEARLQEMAQTKGVNMVQYARQQLGLAEPTVLVPDAENQALIDLMKQWIAEDATDDPEELARRDADTEELLKNLKANRVQFPVPEV